jgi:cobalamin biosynthetic protein CobC
MDGSSARRHGGQPVPHGGNLGDARARYGTPPGGWVDLSTGINPHPYPLPDLPPALWTALPQADDHAALLAAAAGAYGAPSPESLVAAPGTQALIQLLPRVLGSDRAAVIGPTYGEYAPAWRAAGACVREVDDLDAGLAALDGARRPALILCNPNNPDGRRIEPARLTALADRLARRAGTLVVDEAFADVVPSVSVAAAADRSGLVVLRSFGKFFGLAGLRLGFAVAAPDLAAALGRALGPWAVAGPALAVGRTALTDDAWQTAMRARLDREAAELRRLLGRAGLEIAGGTPLYVLARHAQAATCHDRLAREGLWVRAFPERPERLRLGLPGSAAAWERLTAALGRARHG